MVFTILYPEYIPLTKYFMVFTECQNILIADHFQYKKRSAITRSSQLADGLRLTIPIIHNGYQKPVFKKEIAFIENWNLKHLKRIKHLYHNLPYFDDYFFEIENILQNPFVSLSQFLMTLLKWYCKKLRISAKIELTSQKSFNDSITDDLIRYAKENNLETFYYIAADTHGYNFPDFGANDIFYKPFSIPENKELLNTNILEFLFQFGPEAAFILRN